MNTTIAMLDRLKAQDDAERAAIDQVIHEALELGDLRVAHTGHTQVIVFTREELKNFIFFALNNLED